jgi:endonuclease/exonuclease/phosphatase (EEP) superfamily protein YafD
VLTLLQWALAGTGVLAVLVTAVSFSRNPHWSVRIWDFPRVQIALVAALSAAVYAALFFRGRPLQWALLAAVALCVAYQVRKIFPYTPLARVQVERSRKPPRERTRFRLLISNVLMENTRHDLLLKLIRETDPDLVLAVETNARWAQAMEPLAKDYPYVVRKPQENWYGLMLFSRIPLIAPRIDFLVQDDIPSVHTAFELAGGVRVFLHGIHPRPPEPIRDQDSTPRDAELVVVGRAIGESEERPTVVAGDLNDVAWSRSSELFLRLSGMLDPRVGRGFFNSYNANNPFFRYPLDHVFHSSHFRLVEIRRLRSVGSDHFPMLVELSYEPAAQATQPELEMRPEDREEAEEVLEKEAEAAQTGDDRPGRE